MPAAVDAKPNIHQRLNAVRKVVDYVAKEDKMVNGQYRFVSHDAVIAKVRAVLIEQGVSIVPSIRDWRQNGNRTECTLNVLFVNEDNPQDSISVDYLGFGCDPQDKGPGKSMSYALKYCLLKVFLIETGDEADPERDSINHKPAVITNGQINALLDLLLDHRVKESALCKKFSIGGLEDLPQEQYAAAEQWIKGE